MKIIVKNVLTMLASLLFAGMAGAQVLDEFPRTPDGKPDLSGIWQAMTTAHYDVEPHAAAYGPYPREMGALSAKPASLGIVEGGRIPYNEVSRRQRDENARDAITKDPLAKCFMPGGVGRGLVLDLRVCPLSSSPPLSSESPRISRLTRWNRCSFSS